MKATSSAREQWRILLRRTDTSPGCVIYHRRVDGNRDILLLCVNRIFRDAKTLTLRLATCIASCNLFLLAWLCSWEESFNIGIFIETRHRRPNAAVTRAIDNFDRTMKLSNYRTILPGNKRMINLWKIVGTREIAFEMNGKWSWSCFLWNIITSRFKRTALRGTSFKIQLRGRTLILI